MVPRVVDCPPLDCMNLIPYLEFEGIQFGLTEAEVVARLGQPNSRQKNRYGVIELCFEKLILRLSLDSDLVEEITGNTEYLSIFGKEIAFVELGYYVGKNDENSLLNHGFIISPKLGIAFDPHHQYFLTANNKDSFEHWLINSE